MNKKEIFRTIKFTLFSISAGIVEIVVFALLNLIPNWSYWPKYLIALVASVVWNFTLLWNEFIVTALNMIANFVLEYLWDTFVVFRGSIDTKETKRKEVKE